MLGHQGQGRESTGTGGSELDPNNTVDRDGKSQVSCPGCLGHPSPTRSRLQVHPIGLAESPQPQDTETLTERVREQAMPR